MTSNNDSRWQGIREHGDAGRLDEDERGREDAVHALELVAVLGVGARAGALGDDRGQPVVVLGGGLEHQLAADREAEAGDSAGIDIVARSAGSRSPPRCRALRPSRKRWEHRRSHPRRGGRRAGRRSRCRPASGSASAARRGRGTRSRWRRFARGRTSLRARGRPPSRRPRPHGGRRGRPRARRRWIHAWSCSRARSGRRTCRGRSPLPPPAGLACRSGRAGAGRGAVRSTGSWLPGRPAPGRPVSASSPVKSSPERAPSLA